MWLAILRTNARFLTLPIAIGIGYVGTIVESRFYKKPSYRESVIVAREERLNGDLSVPDSLNAMDLKKIMPKTILDKNVSPSLQESD